MSDMDKMLAFWLPFRVQFKASKPVKAQPLDYSKVIYEKEHFEQQLEKPDESDDYYDEEGDVMEECKETDNSIVDPLRMMERNLGNISAI